LSNLTVQGLEKLVEQIEDLTMDAISHKLCLVGHIDARDINSKVQIMPITDYIESQLDIYLQNIKQADQV
jgi:hypothetical protein